MIPLIFSSLSRRGALCVALVLFAALSGCGGGGGGGVSPVEGDWSLTLQVDGRKVEVPVRVLYVYVSGDDEALEPFELIGEGVALVGTVPRSSRVGYGEDWKALLGSTLTLTTEAGYPRESERTYLTLPGRAEEAVVGGELRPEKISGEKAGLEGNITLSGKVSIRVRGADGDRTCEGTFRVHAVTLG